MSVPSCTLSIHFFRCLPWFLLALIEQYNMFAGSRSLPTLETCSNRVNLRCAILSISWCRVPPTVSFIVDQWVTLNAVLLMILNCVFVVHDNSILHWFGPRWFQDYACVARGSEILYTRSCQLRGSIDGDCVDVVAETGARVWWVLWRMSAWILQPASW